MNVQYRSSGSGALLPRDEKPSNKTAGITRCQSRSTSLPVQHTSTPALQDFSQLKQCNPGSPAFSFRSQVHRGRLVVCSSDSDCGNLPTNCCSLACALKVCSLYFHNRSIRGPHYGPGPSPGLALWWSMKQQLWSEA